MTVDYHGLNQIVGPITGVPNILSPLEQINIPVVLGIDLANEFFSIPVNQESFKVNLPLC